jgi:hypothetical protein
MKIEIWMEGYLATGGHGTAQKIGEYEAENLDRAIEMYIKDHPDEVHINTRSRYPSDEAYKKRRSNYNIWACDLFDNEADARKSFG